MSTLFTSLVLMSLLVLSLPGTAAERYYSWQVKDFAIAKPLAGLTGDIQRGRKLVLQRNKGNCLACHALPIEEEAFHGSLGPALHGIGDRLTVAQLRLRIVNQQSINPYTVMPNFYQDPKTVNRIAQDYIGTTILTAQEVEDVVAYLASLKQEPQP